MLNFLAPEWKYWIAKYAFIETNPKTPSYCLGWGDFFIHISSAWRDFFCKWLQMTITAAWWKQS